jgi:hypothetical protein
MNLRTPLAALALALMAATAAHAQSTPRVDERQDRQEQRIDKGTANGQLTKREARRLEAEQNAIDKAEDKAKADGTVTKRERVRLHAMQNGASRDIRRQKHDAQTPKAP